jgi:thioredoxin
MLNVAEIKTHLQSAPAVLVYFKNDNCAPCLVLRPKVKALLAAAFPKIEMLVVDTIARPEFAGEFQVYANPTLLVFFDGKECIRKSKFVAIPELKAEIGRLYGMMFA